MTEQHPHLRGADAQEDRIKQRADASDDVSKREALADELQNEMETKTPMEAVRDDAAAMKEDVAETFGRNKDKDKD